MMLYSKIKADITQAFKAGEKNKVNLLKTLISDIQRNPQKNYSDQEVIKVIKQTVKRLEEAKKHLSNAKEEIEILKSYLPEEVGEAEILAYLKTIDFSKLKSPKMAIGIAKRHFEQLGKSVDAKLISKLVERCPSG